MTPTLTCKPDLSKVSTRFLVEELNRRAKDAVKRSHGLARPWRYCDECACFFREKAACARGHEIKLRVPADMHEAVTSDWGYYRRGCSDYVAAPDPEATS